MSWLKDRTIQYLFRAHDGEEIILEYRADKEAPGTVTVEGRSFKRVSMLPYKVNLTFKVQFERNGLVAYKYDMGGGKTRVVSATRENYEKNMGNISGDKLREMKAQGRLSELSKSVLTKGYKDAYTRAQAKKGVR